jgi:hypothetical protein
VLFVVGIEVLSRRSATGSILFPVLVMYLLALCVDGVLFAVGCELPYTGLACACQNCAFLGAC